jgi:hypothetical protein
MVDQSFGFQRIWSVSKDLVSFKGFGRLQRIWSVSKDLVGFKGLYRTFLVFLGLILSFALGLLLLDNTKMQTLSRLP